jgi:hypothetical protein
LPPRCVEFRRIKHASNHGLPLQIAYLNRVASFARSRVLCCTPGSLSRAQLVF